MKHTVFQVQLDSCIELNIRHHLDPKLATQVDALMLSITCNEERATCCCCFSYSVMFNCLQPHGLQLSRFLCSWDFLGKHTGVGRHFLLQGVLPNPGIKPAAPSMSPVLQTDSLPLSQIYGVHSRFLLVIYFTHSNVYMSIPIFQFITPSTFSPGNHRFSLYICDSISVLK